VELRGFVGPQPPQPPANLIPRPDADGPLAVGQQAEKGRNRRVQLRQKGMMDAHMLGIRRAPGARQQPRPISDRGLLGREKRL
jgi:hypothetical protein